MTRIFAHRGSTRRSKENTIEAFLEAEKHGAGWVEFDVWQGISEDAKNAENPEGLIVHHNARLKDGRLLVETTPSDLPDYIPTLPEALKVCQGMRVGMGVNIEIKDDDASHDANHDIAAAVVKTALRYFDYEKILVSSFNFDILTNIKKADPKIPTGLLFFNPTAAEQNIERALRGGHNAIHPHISSVDEKFIELAHRPDSRLDVNVWTVNKKEQIKNMIELGVDGIITDRVKLVKKILKREN